MKRLCVFLLLFSLFLGGCTGEREAAVHVSILEGEGFSVENNGQWVAPGQDAVFYLETDAGIAVGGTDYPGAYHLALVDGKLVLTLEGVRYPACVGLRLTERFARITYEPNGAPGEPITEQYDLSYHLRPNTAGALFAREGFTLTGWNTAPDGTGTAVGLRSRVDADQAGLTLYAQWAKWAPEEDFVYTVGQGITITGYHGTGDTIAIPAVIHGKPVTAIAHRAFLGCEAEWLVLPETMAQVALGAFQDCDFRCVVLFDSIESISGDSFRNCPALKTVYINAAESPCGYAFRKESCYADKIDLLICSRGRKLVCYGGCSMWYNLDGARMQEALGDGYTVVNLGLNGLVNSGLQMQILSAFLEEGDILFHTPELSSSAQMMKKRHMDEQDDTLWAGLEYNYDLVSLVDFQTVPGLLDSFSGYLARKAGETDYTSCYRDSQGRTYLDEWGGIPFARTETMEMLSDRVTLDPACIEGEAMAVLKGYYDRLQAKGVRVYVGFACVNLDALPEDQRGNAPAVEEAFRAAVEAMDGPAVIGSLTDHLYENKDFYDTNYHLLSDSAGENTDAWLEGLLTQMERDRQEAAE